MSISEDIQAYSPYLQESSIVTTAQQNCVFLLLPGVEKAVAAEGKDATGGIHDEVVVVFDAEDNDVVAFA